MTRLLVLGATGDVGRGIVREATNRGWTVLASSRHVSQCPELDLPGVTRIPTDGTVAADLDRLVDVSDAADLDAVVVATSPTTTPASGAETGTAAFVGYVADTLWPHHSALRAFLPHLRPGALFLGIGGGMADLVVRGYGHASAAQAAQRMLYRSTAKETASGVVVRELLIRSMVSGDSNRDRAPAEWLTDAEIGRHVCDLVAEEHDAGGEPVWELARQSAG